MASTSKKLTINAISAIIQVAFTAILYFFLYKYLLDHLGVKLLGVWSLILSFSSIANLANLGLTSGLVKFVADFIAENQYEKIGKLILTSFLSLAVLFCLVALLVLAGATYFLHYVIDAKFLDVAFSILPYSLASLCMNAMSGVFTSVLEGYQKNYLRNFIYIFSGIVMYASTVWLAPDFQLRGVAMAQLLQSGVVFLFALYLMWRVSPYNRFAFWKWSSKTFKELFDYGYKFQAVSICQLLYEPTTKLLLSKYGGLALLGHYEMATKLVNQFRALLVSANQVVIPVVAETIKTQTKAYLQDFYAKMTRIMLSATLPLSTLMMVLTPLISIIWIGQMAPDFTFAMYVLTIASTFNIMCGPAYFSCMGEGRLTLLVIVHVLMAVLNLAFGYVLGRLFEGNGIIVAWGLSLTIGSLLLLVVYSKKIRSGFSKLFRKEEIQIFLISILVTVFSIVLFSTPVLPMGAYFKTLISVLLLGSFIPVLLKSELIKQLVSKIRKNDK